MDTPARRSVRALEVVLSLLVVVTTVLWLGQHAPWRAIVDGHDLWPLFLQLGVPALLGVVVIVGAVLDGLEVGSTLVAVLGLTTLWVAASSVYTLLFPPEGGGVFFGGVLTLYAGLALAIVVVARAVVHRFVREPAVQGSGL